MQVMAESWKQNKEYMRELQRFLDRADNIKEQELKEDIIKQMLKCDNLLTKLAERAFLECYKKGYKDSIKENKMEKLGT